MIMHEIAQWGCLTPESATNRQVQLQGNSTEKTKPVCFVVLYYTFLPLKVLSFMFIYCT